MMKKRGVSPVIATVLLIMITVIVASLIAYFVIPFVNKGLDEGKTCFDVLGELEAYNSGYNCYYTNTTMERTGFSISVSNDKITGFVANIVSAGSADSIRIYDGTLSENLRMLGSDFNQAMDFPETGGVRTYVYKGKADVVEIYALVGEDVCDLSDTIQLKQCTTQEIVDGLAEY